jgi:hypothetical protein
MKRSMMITIATLAASLAGHWGCAPRAVTTTQAVSGAKTDECQLQDEICTEALNFQREFDRMPEEERRDFIPVLNSFEQQCREARRNCEKSRRRLSR